MFERLSLRFKLACAFLFLAALLVGASYYQVAAIKHFDDLFVNLVGVDFGRLNALDNLRASSAQLYEQTVAYQQTVAEGSPSEITVFQAEHTSQANELASDRDTYLKLAKSGSQVDAGHLQALNSTVSNVIEASDAVIAATGPKPAQKAPVTLVTTLTTAQDSLRQTVGGVIATEQRNIAAGDTAIAKTVRRLLGTVVTLALAITALGVSLGVFVASRIARAISRLRMGAERIANGDFSERVRVASHDEIGQLARAFNQMSDRLRDSYQRLALETARNKTLLQSLGEGVIAIDEDTNIMLINYKALELLELPDREKVMGIPVNHAFTVNDEHDQPITAVQTPVVVALQTSLAAGGVFTLHTKAGAKRKLAIAADPVIVNDETAGAIMTLRDVTKEKEVDRMKTEFISLASHQLRTPLSAIRWFTELLISGDAGELQPEQLEFTKNIADSTERMIALVNALLNISRIESGRIMVDPKPTDLKELVSGIVNDLKAKIEERRQTLIISVHEGLPKINLDPRLIGQVYLNLLTNAVKYTPKGGEISVFISRKDDDIISQVTDNGYGIPKEQQGHLFQRFFRATNAVKVETDGTGLGLYLIKAVIESSGGRIWFESEENKGTTFWFSIPASGMQPKEGEVTLDA